MGRAALMIFLVLLAGCATAQPHEPAEPVEDTAVQETSGAGKAEAGDAGAVIDGELRYPLVPDVTADTYGLKGRDAALFQGAMAQFEGFEKPSEDLWLPNVAVLGEYEEDGETVELTWVQIWQLYGYQGPDIPMTAGGGGNYAVMRLRQGGDGTWECLEALHNYFGDPEEFLLESCGGERRELVEKVLAVDTDAPPEGSAWFGGMEEALARYEAYTGMTIPYTSE